MDVKKIEGSFNSGSDDSLDMKLMDSHYEYKTNDVNKENREVSEDVNYSDDIFKYVGKSDGLYYRMNENELRDEVIKKHFLIMDLIKREKEKRGRDVSEELERIVNENDNNYLFAVVENKMKKNPRLAGFWSDSDWLILRFKISERFINENNNKMEIFYKVENENLYKIFNESSMNASNKLIKKNAINCVYYNVNNGNIYSDRTIDEFDYLKSNRFYQFDKSGEYINFCEGVRFFNIWEDAINYLKKIYAMSLRYGSRFDRDKMRELDDGFMGIFEHNCEIIVEPDYAHLKNLKDKNNDRVKSFNEYRFLGVDGVEYIKMLDNRDWYINDVEVRITKLKKQGEEFSDKMCDMIYELFENDWMNIADNLDEFKNLDNEMMLNNVINCCRSRYNQRVERGDKPNLKYAEMTSENFKNKIINDIETFIKNDKRCEGMFIDGEYVYSHYFADRKVHIISFYDDFETLMKDEYKQQNYPIKIDGCECGINDIVELNKRAENETLD